MQLATFILFYSIIYHLYDMIVWLVSLWRAFYKYKYLKKARAYKYCTVLLPCVSYSTALVRRTYAQHLSARRTPSSSSSSSSSKERVLLCACCVVRRVEWVVLRLTPPRISRRSTGCDRTRQFRNSPILHLLQPRRKRGCRSRSLRRRKSGSRSRVIIGSRPKTRRRSPLRSHGIRRRPRSPNKLLLLGWSSQRSDSCRRVPPPPETTLSLSLSLLPRRPW